MFPPRHRSAVRFLPRLESLEDRCLLAGCTISVPGTGTLLVRGGRSPGGRIRILDDGTANVNNVVVACGGKEMLPGVAVTTIDVQAHGDNSIVYRLDAPLLTRGTRGVFVHLGGGHNTFLAKFRAGLQANASLILQVNGGAASNTLFVDARNNIPIAAGAVLSAALSGGPSPDTLLAAYRGQLLGTMVLFEAGGGGNDNLVTDLTLNQGSRGTGSVQELGGFGDDTLTVSGQKVSLLDAATITGAIDGGPGINTAVATSGVTVTNAKHKTGL